MKRSADPRRLGLPSVMIGTVIAALLGGLAAITPSVTGQEKEKAQELKGVYKKNDQIIGIYNEQISAAQESLSMAQSEVADAQSRHSAALSEYRSSTGRLIETRARVRETQKARDDVYTELKKQVDADERLPQYLQAVAEAQAAYDEAREKALKPLLADTDYQQAAEELAEARDRFEFLKKRRLPLNVAIVKVVELDTKVNTMQQATLAEDDQYLTAEAALNEAKRALFNLEKELEQKIKGDAGFARAQADFVRATQELNALQVEIERSQSRMTAADADYKKALVKVRQHSYNLQLAQARLKATKASKKGGSYNRDND